MNAVDRRIPTRNVLDRTRIPGSVYRWTDCLNERTNERTNDRFLKFYKTTYTHELGMDIGMGIGMDGIETGGCFHSTTVDHGRFVVVHWGSGVTWCGSFRGRAGICDHVVPLVCSLVEVGLCRLG